MYYSSTDQVSLYPWTTMVFHCTGTGGPRIFCGKMVPGVASGNDDDIVTSSGDSYKAKARIWEGIGLGFIAAFVVALLLLGWIWTKSSNRPDPEITDSLLPKI